MGDKWQAGTTPANTPWNQILTFPSFHQTHLCDLELKLHSHYSNMSSLTTSGPTNMNLKV
ncbi:hypothetical protein DsansV1_C04g0036941 [Dioscorea sansibarensis]